MICAPKLDTIGGAYLFFATNKKALFREKYSTLNELKAIIDEYILFYNSDRPHYKLNLRTPDEAEKEYYEGLSV